MKGILNIDKPEGITSHTVISKARKILGYRHIGHMGTLDPQGTGVLLLGVGKAARLFDFFLKKDKVYEAEFTFGYETDTLDKDGQIIKNTDSIPTIDAIKEKLIFHTGKLNQLPPLYSAKNVDGRRAYDLAREGKEFELKPSIVEVYNIDFLNQADTNTYKFRIHCSGGTYIRSICRDLAYSLGSLATMVSINRTKCGSFLLEDSVSLSEFESLKQSALISCENALKDLPKLELDESYYQKLLNGTKLNPFKNEIPQCFKDFFTVFCCEELFGIGHIENNILKIGTYLKD